LYSFSSIAVAVTVAAADMVSSRVFVNTAVLGFIAPDSGSGGAAGEFATTASLSTTTPPIEAQTWR
jgi:hypothetical protein